MKYLDSPMRAHMECSGHSWIPSKWMQKLKIFFIVILEGGVQQIINLQVIWDFFIWGSLCDITYVYS